MGIAVNIVIGACLRKHRKRREMTQCELAEAMGRTQSFVSKVETGERGLGAAELFEYVIALDEDFTIIAEEIRLGLSRAGYLPE